jgi:hypothetical protein
MGANKNSSRRMNSAYASNSQPRVPTRVCQGHIVTTDLPTLGTNPKQSQRESETQEAKDLGNLQLPGRTVPKEGADCPGTRQTVHELAADCLKMVPEPPVVHYEKRTVRPLPADRPRRANCPISPRGPSAKPRATKNTRRNGSKRRHSRTRDELEEH